MPFSIPPDIQSRPIAVIGSGTLGRRIALMMSTQGGEVRLYDKAQHSLEEGVRFVEETLPAILPSIPNSRAARVTGIGELAAAVDGAWLVFESVPERLDLKIEIFEKLDSVSSSDAILASNSSSFPASQLISGAKRPERILNTHFYMPPVIRAVELMASSRTDPKIMDLLMERFELYGLIPFRVQKESVGFIFNRIWAAIKRESLSIAVEGVSDPADVDRLFTIVSGVPVGPFRNMDAVGLDVVLDVEEHYASIRPGIPDGPRELLKGYLAKGWAGRKTGRGFYNDYDTKD
jgi:3-hydroxybutyryl-CoA dehydrogenase